MPFPYSNAKAFHLDAGSQREGLDTNGGAAMPAERAHDFHYHIGCTTHRSPGRDEVRIGVDEAARRTHVAIRSGNPSTSLPWARGSSRQRRVAAYPSASVILLPGLSLWLRVASRPGPRRAGRSRTARPRWHRKIHNSFLIQKYPVPSCSPIKRISMRETLVKTPVSTPWSSW